MESIIKTLFLLIILMITFTKSLEIKQVSVLFRHGDRAPDRGAEQFLNDPHSNNPFFPGGRGGLTNAGKLRAFRLGELIREKYTDFLGDVYSSSEVFARSTDTERTMMTLHLVMAGVFPPTGAQKWHPTLDWQPVVSNFLIGARNFLDYFSICPAYHAELKRIKNTGEMSEKMNSYKDYYEYLTRLTGNNINTLHGVARLYHALTAELAMGLELPDWAEEIYNNSTLLNAVFLDYEMENYNTILKKLNGGRVLKFILDSMRGIIEGRSSVKLNLLSGHESTIVALLSTLGLYQRHVPAYSSALFVELLEDGSDHFVKVQYYRSIPPVFEELTIPGCNSPCPLENFKTLLEDVTPTADELDCKTSQPSHYARQDSCNNSVQLTYFGA